MSEHNGPGVTRDEDFPAEIAQLFQAFNRCADGYGALSVLEASANMLIASIVFRTREVGGDREQAAILANSLGTSLQRHVVQQWDRTPMPTDIKVPHGN